MPLPLLLARPILRRVEPRLVSVWVALSRQCPVELDVWQGAQTASTTVEPLGGFGSVAAAIAKRVGENLFIALVTKTFPEPQLPLIPDQLYSYDLSFHLPDRSGEPDSQFLGLLQDGIVSGRPHLALGYGGDQLPSFALPPCVWRSCVCSTVPADVCTKKT